MRAFEHGDVVARRDDVEARVLADRDEVAVAVDLLDRAEAGLGVPLVDESERERLEGLAAGEQDRAPHWHSVLARRDGDAVGYAGLMLAGDGEVAAGEVAIDRGVGDVGCGPVLGALLASLDRLAAHHDAARLRVWLRHASNVEITCAADEGFGLERRLAILGRDLVDGVEAVAPPAGHEIRAYAEPDDDAGVVDVLAAAYGDGPDGGWTADAFAQRRDYDWFRAEDLLLAVAADGAVVGLHWLKRRDASTGEVYNLAIHPDAQGRGLGSVLLTAGLAHLAASGHDDVLLWVDRANEPAVRLYATHGFCTRWEDAAFLRTLRRSGTTDQSSSASRGVPGGTSL